MDRVRERSAVTRAPWGVLLLALGVAALTIVLRMTPSPEAATIVLTHGPVTGAVTSTTAKVFLRTSVQTTGILRVTGVKGTDTISDFPFATGSAADFTTQVSLTNLVPSATYTLNVIINGTLQAQTGRFTAFPPLGSTDPFTFVVLSDFAGPSDFPGPGSAFVRADGENPDLVIIGGDFDHSNPHTQVEKRQMFKSLYDPALMPTFVPHILSRYALAHFWDDHDYGLPNGNKEYGFKALSLQVLGEYFPVYPMSANGDWQRFSYAAADFFLLDSRSQRDRNTNVDGPKHSMLDGDNLGALGQLYWLQQGLLASTARWKFILSPVVFNPTLTKVDSWYGFQDERTKLVSFIAQNQIRGVVIISGDLHAGAIDNGTHSTFPEMLVPAANLSRNSRNRCLSGRRRDQPNPTGTWTEGIYYTPGANAVCNGYGVVKVTMTSVTLQVKDENGAPVISYVVLP